MIYIKYRGGIGNRFFVYCYGRILAERFNYTLGCNPIEGFSNTQPIKGYKYTQNDVKMTLGNMDAIIKDLEKNINHKIIMAFSIQRYSNN